MKNIVIVMLLATLGMNPVYALDLSGVEKDGEIAGVCAVWMLYMQQILILEAQGSAITQADANALAYLEKLVASLPCPMSKDALKALVIYNRARSAEAKIAAGAAQARELVGEAQAAAGRVANSQPVQQAEQKAQGWWSSVVGLVHKK